MIRNRITALRAAYARVQARRRMGDTLPLDVAIAALGAGVTLDPWQDSESSAGEFGRMLAALGREDAGLAAL